MLKSGDPGAMLASGQTGAVLAVWKSGDKLTKSTGWEGRPKWVAQQKNMGHRNRKKSAETMGKQTARPGQTGAGGEVTNRDLP